MYNDDYWKFIMKVKTNSVCVRQDAEREVLACRRVMNKER